MNKNNLHANAILAVFLFATSAWAIPSSSGNGWVLPRSNPDRELAIIAQTPSPVSQRENDIARIIGQYLDDVENRSILSRVFSILGNYFNLIETPSPSASPLSLMSSNSDSDSSSPQLLHINGFGEEPEENDSLTERYMRLVTRNESLFTPMSLGFLNAEVQIDARVYDRVSDRRLLFLVHDEHEDTPREVFIYFLQGTSHLGQLHQYPLFARSNAVAQVFQEISRRAERIIENESNFQRAIELLMPSNSISQWRASLEEQTWRIQNVWPLIAGAQLYYPNLLNTYLLLEALINTVDASMDRFSPQNTINSESNPQMQWVYDSYGRLMDEATEMVHLLHAYTDQAIHIIDADMGTDERSDDDETIVKKKKKKKKKKNKKKKKTGTNASPQSEIASASSSSTSSSPVERKENDSQGKGEEKRKEKDKDDKKQDEKEQAGSRTQPRARSNGNSTAPIDVRSLLSLPISAHEASALMSALNSRVGRVLEGMLSSDFREYHRQFTLAQVELLAQRLVEMVSKSQMKGKNEFIKRMIQLIKHLHAVHGPGKDDLLPADYVRKLRSYLLMGGLFTKWPTHGDDYRLLERLLINKE